MENTETKAVVHISTIDTLLILWGIWKPDVIPYIFIGYGVIAILSILFAMYKASQQ